MPTILCPRLVGRATEAAALHRLVSSAAAGAGAAHALLGEAGMGKSRLVQDVVAVAHDAAAAVAVGRCAEGRAATPLRPLSEAVTALVRDQEVPAGPGLAPYLPVLARLTPDLLPAGAAAGATDPDPVHLGEGLLRLLTARGAGRGALLIVEDLHAADPLTLAVLEYIADALTAPGWQAGLSLLLTSRPEPSPGRDLVSALTARRAVGITALPVLPAAQVEELVRACLPDLPDAVVQVVAERAAGVPFLAEELLSASVDDDGNVDPERVAAVVPLSLADAVHRRTAALAPEVRELLLLAALVGRSADPALLAAGTARTAEQVVAALQPARAAQLLALDEPCTFRHGLTRDAVLSGVLPGERAAQARRLLGAAAAGHAEADVVGTLAEYCDDHRAAARAWLAAAEDAVARGLPNGAETALRRAEGRARAAADRELEGDVARCRLAAFALAGRAEDVLRLCDRLRAEAVLTPEALQELHLPAARAALDAGQHRRAECELAGCDAADAFVLALGALVALADGRLAEAQARAQRVLDLPDPPPAAVCEAWEALGRLRRPNDLEGAAAAFGAAHATARAAGLALWEVRALHELGTVDMFLSGRPDRLEEAHRAATAVGGLTTRAVLDVQIASCLALALEPAAALERAAAAGAVAEQIGARPLAAAAAVIAAHAHGYAGRWVEADREAARALVLSEDDPETRAMLAGLLDGLGGLLAEDRERADRGFAQLAVLLPLAPRMPPTPAQTLRVLVGAVDGAAWTAAARAEARLAGLATVPYNALLLAYADAVELGRAGDAVAAQRRVTEADAALQAVDPGPVVQRLRCLALRLIAEAALRDGWGEPPAWLREAVVEFDDRAPAVAAACRQLLRQAGVRAPRRGGGAAVPERLRAVGITAREHEVLLLVAAGSSNREVADRLYLSPRTVETHVGRLLDKTGASGRAELASWATGTADVSGADGNVRTHS